MQERVTAQGEDDFADVVVQWNNDLMQVGIGLEPTTRPEVPTHHFMDRIYGGVPNQTRIGQIFFDTMNEIGLIHDQPDFQSRDEEAEWFNNLGRRILDSVTGSRPESGLWTWLDRPGVNRLIRLLRTARDKSFGRDE
jgi:hypothetical protein